MKFLINIILNTLQGTGCKGLMSKDMIKVLKIGTQWVHVYWLENGGGGGLSHERDRYG